MKTIDLINLYESGMSIVAIAEQYQTYPAKIRRAIKKERPDFKFRPKTCHLSGPSNPKYTGYEEIQGAYFSGLKYAARRRNLVFDLKIEDAWNLFVQQDRKCAITKLELTFAKNNADHRTGNYTASIDRIDNSGGYTIDNVQWVHKRVNIMKGNMSMDEFLTLCSAVVTNQYDGQTMSFEHHGTRIKK
jgi:hypothetical protein